MPDSLTSLALNPDALDAFARRVGAARIDFYSEVDSTQDVARALGESGAAPWSVVIADRQTAGRGQHGRAWRDSRADSILLSILLRPTDPASMSLLPIRLALAITAALETLPEPHRPKIKWPNDLVIDDRKLGGILVEGQTRGNDLVAIAGIGMNILAAPELPDDPLAMTPIALADIDPAVTRLATLESMLRALRTYPFLSRPTLEPSEIAAYRERDWLLGRRITEPVAGVGHGIDMSGHLVVVEDAGVIRNVLAGRVRAVDGG
jgi:biotin-[acetyl-CoA-carboxylase] ligase BirA-like protein